MGFWTTANTEYKDWLKAGKKIKKGVTPEESGTVTETLETYGEIAGKYESVQGIGMSLLPYAPQRTGINAFQGGILFERGMGVTSAAPNCAAPNDAYLQARKELS